MLAPKKYGARRLLGPEEEPGQGGPRPFTVLIKRFGDPEEGPQFTDQAGNPVPRPLGA